SFRRSHRRRGQRRPCRLDLSFSRGDDCPGKILSPRTRRSRSMNEIFANAKFGADGLIPAIVQDAHTREVLTVAYMNKEALQLTLDRRETHFWSRSRQKLWRK